MGRRIHMATFDKESGKAILQRRNIITKMRYTTVKCKFCGDWESVVQYGRSAKGTQRYLCQKCKRTFLDNKAKGQMQYPIEAVAAALNMFYESASLAKIQRQLQQIYNVRPTRSIIYKWIVDYSHKASKMLETVPIRTGSTWVADETVLRLKAKEKKEQKQWFWDIMDEKTRFLLASYISPSRETKDARTLMERASERAGKAPKVVLTDKLAAYLDGVELAYGADTRHRQGSPFTVENNINLIERFHGTLKERTKVMRSFMRKDTAKVFANGWLVHYNFFRPLAIEKKVGEKTIIESKTPAESAGAETEIKSWRDVVKGESK